MSPAKKLAKVTDADDATGEVAAVEEADRGPGPDQAVTHTLVTTDPVEED